jgi:hypothetical protein
MDIHIKINGDIIDLHSLKEEEYKKYMKAYSAFMKNLETKDFKSLIIEFFPVSDKLGEALFDLEERLAIRRGEKEPPEGYTEFDPCQKEEYVNASEAARRKGLTMPPIVHACKRGRIAAHQDKRNGRWKISERSLERYSVDRTNQQNARSRWEKSQKS